MSDWEPALGKFATLTPALAHLRAGCTVCPFASVAQRTAPVPNLGHQGYKNDEETTLRSPVRTTETQNSASPANQRWCSAYLQGILPYDWVCTLNAHGSPDREVQ